MKLKRLAEYLRPDKVKIAASLALILLSLAASELFELMILRRASIFDPVANMVLSTFTLLFATYFILAWYPMMLFYMSMPMFIIAVVLAVSYVFGCYIATHKKLIEAIILYFAAFAIIGGMLYMYVFGHNFIFASSCEKDRDCTIKCDDIMGDYSANKNFIYMLPDSCGSSASVCVDKRCHKAEK